MSNQTENKPAVTTLNAIFGIPTVITQDEKERPYVIEDLVATYNAKGTLGGLKYIFCTKTLKKITCFGGNLHGKVHRYGGIENLLTKFVCKDAGGVMVRTQTGVSEVEVKKLMDRIAELEAKNAPAPAAELKKLEVIDVQAVEIVPPADTDDTFEAEMALLEAEEAKSNQLQLADSENE